MERKDSSPSKSKQTIEPRTKKRIYYISSSEDEEEKVEKPKKVQKLSKKKLNEKVEEQKLQKSIKQWRIPKKQENTSKSKTNNIDIKLNIVINPDHVKTEVESPSKTIHKSQIESNANKQNNLIRNNNKHEKTTIKEETTPEIKEEAATINEETDDESDNDDLPKRTLRNKRTNVSTYVISSSEENDSIEESESEPEDKPLINNTKLKTEEGVQIQNHKDYNSSNSKGMETNSLDSDVEFVSILDDNLGTITIESKTELLADILNKKSESVSEAEDNCDNIQAEDIFVIEDSDDSVDQNITKITSDETKQVNELNNLESNNNILRLSSPDLFASDSCERIVTYNKSDNESIISIEDELVDTSSKQCDINESNLYEFLLDSENFIIKDETSPTPISQLIYSQNETESIRTNETESIRTNETEATHTVLELPSTIKLEPSENLPIKSTLDSSDVESSDDSSFQLTPDYEDNLKYLNCIDNKNKFYPAGSSKQEYQDIKKDVKPIWREEQVIQEHHNVHPAIANQIVTLFEEGNTIPFIARYRKSAIGQMSAEQLRDIKTTYDNAILLKQKVTSTINKIHKLGKLNDDLERTLLEAKDNETFDEIYAAFKPELESNKKAIHAVLEEAANAILQGDSNIQLSDYLNKAKGLDDLQSIEKELIHVLAKKISVLPPCFAFINKMKEEVMTDCYLETRKIKKRNKVKEEKPPTKIKGKGKDEGSKYEEYYNMEYRASTLKPHQILAINRAEHLKFLQVMLHFTDSLQKFCYEIWKYWTKLRQSSYAPLLNKALIHCYENIIVPILKRSKRAELKAIAEKSSLEVFSRNLKHILLATPIKGKKIMGVDPGFTNGCKLGVISETGSVLATSVVYPHTGNGKKIGVHSKVFRDLLLEHKCSLIALGNGTACRETESWITDMIAQGMFKPLEVSYTIVNESGASIYSCSKEAIKEFQNLDPNKISAVSLARRIQDPLAELVKVEPKHLGIGMYQHDINAKRLEQALTDVVSECVSFVGVDLNTSSQCLLKYIAGLTDKRATDIITYRETNGAFSSREELLNIKGIGPHSFKQCAGFLKIFGGSNKLEVTSVHPESYNIAEKIITHLNLSIDDVGTENFTQVIKREQAEILKNCSKFCSHPQTLETVLGGLTESINYDLRDKDDKRPLFRSGATSVESIRKGMVLTGSVTNVTSFGSFVDIGVGMDALLHVSKSRGATLNAGDRIEVKILDIELQRKRIAIELIKRF